VKYARVIHGLVGMEEEDDHESLEMNPEAAGVEIEQRTTYYTYCK
jgi:hypothetical protein